MSLKACDTAESQVRAASSVLADAPNAESRRRPQASPLGVDPELRPGTITGPACSGGGPVITCLDGIRRTSLNCTVSPLPPVWRDSERGAPPTVGRRLPGARPVPGYLVLGSDAQLLDAIRQEINARLDGLRPLARSERPPARP